MERFYARTAAGVAAILALGGCLGEQTSQDGAGFVARLNASDQTPQIVSGATTAKDRLAAQSPIIQDLVTRRSVLPRGLAFDEVASAVLAANSRASESRLRAAKLRSDAASKTWSGRIGPDISLVSLASVVAGLAQEANGLDDTPEQAERAFAKADIEVAAVTLAQDSNDRVFEALELYLLTQAGREQSAVDDITLKDMNEFLYIMSEQVRGGGADASDLRVIQQKVADIRSAYTRNQELARAAIDALNAMAVHPLNSVIGLNAVRVNPGLAQPLSVLRSQAEQARAVARAKMEHASDRPAETARARIDAPSGSDIRTDADPAAGAEAGLRAITLAEEAAARIVSQAEENAKREMRQLESQIAAVDRQSRAAAKETRAVRKTMDAYHEDVKAGRREGLDVVQVYDSYVRVQEREIALRYEAARLRLDLARMLGLLADGEAI